MIEGPRGSRAEDLPGVIGLVDAAMRQGSDQTLVTDYPLVYAPENLPNVQVVLVDGVPVATAPVLPKRVTGEGFSFGTGVISPTATDPAHQHRGYGSACVRGCIERMIALELPVSVLWTIVATFPFYEGVGYQAVARFGASYRLGSGDAGRFAAWNGPIVSLASGPDRLEGVRALHEARDGVRRTPEEAAALFRLPKMTTWLAPRDGAVSGYLVESRASNKPGILEGLGDAAAVEGLVRHVLARLAPAETIDLHVGFAPDTLADVAATRLDGVEPTPFAGNMMVRLNDPTAFLRSVRPWLARQGGLISDAVSIEVADTGELVSIEPRPFGMAIGSRQLDRHVRLTARELTSVLFGAHPERPVDIPPEIAWLPPFRIPIPILDRS